MFRYFILMCLLFSFAVKAENKPRVIWLTADIEDLTKFHQSAPYNIGTDTEKLLFKALQQYQIELQVVSLARADKLLQGEQSYCLSSRIKTAQRAKVNLFSLPVMLYPGFKFYWLANKVSLPKSMLNEHGQLISLPQLFKLQPKTVLGLSHGRAHGEYLDRQISLIAERNLLVRAGKRRLLFLVKVLNAGEFDYLIELPTEIKRVSYLLEQPQFLRSVEIAGSAPYMLGHMACSKTAQNRQFIEDVNIALQRLYKTEKFYQAHAQHLDKTDLPSFKKYYKEAFASDPLLNK